MQNTDEDPEIPVSMDDFTVIDPSTGEAYNAEARDQLALDIDHPVLLSIAASDPSGVRGNQVDLKVFQALGAHGSSVITGIDCPANHASIHFDSGKLDLQWEAISQNCPPLGVKISGELSEDTVKWLGEKLAMLELLTVAVADFSDNTSSEDFLNSWRFYLLPYMSTLILSRDEAAILSGQACTRLEEVEGCAAHLLQYGCRSVLIVDKPLSSSGKDPVLDFWSNGAQSAWLRSQGVAGSHHQDGHWDVLACGMLFHQVQAYNELDALILARMLAQQSLRQRYPLGEQLEALWTFGSLNRKDVIPELSETLPLRMSDSFCAPLRQLSPGWIPVSAKADALAPYFDAGASTAVLHIANSNHPRLEEEIQSAIDLSDRHDGQLFIQKHWQLALEHEAFGVLLHAADLEQADLETIMDSGLRLGIIIKSYTDLAAAMYWSPSCIVIGPIYAKEPDLQSPALGEELFQNMRKIIPVPVFAMGEIKEEQEAELSQTGSDGYLFDLSQLSEEQEKARLETFTGKSVENSDL